MKEGWKTKTLDTVASIYNGNSINADYKKKHFLGLAEGYPFIATKDVAFDGTVDYNNGVRIPFNTDYKIAEPDSVFICVEGGSAGRKIAYIDQKVCFGNKLFCVKPLSSHFVGKFVYYFLISEAFQVQFRSLLTGLIGGVSAKKFKSITISYPPLPDQQRIVSYLDAEFAKIEALKANAEKQLQAAKDLFQAALKELLTPKEGWKMKTIDSLQTDMYRGSGITREQIRLEGVPCVRYGEIYTTYNYWFEECVSHTDGQIINSKKYFEHGDILFAITGESVEDIGKSIAYLGHNKCLAGGDIIVMKHNQNPKYLAYALSTPDAIAQKGFGKTKLKVVHTNAPSLKAIVLPIPTLSEQQRIADRLDALSANVKALQTNYAETITLCNDLKQALLKKVFG